MTQQLTQISDHLYQFADTCNVYLIRDGRDGLLIDAGSGAILDHLSEAAVDNVEWVLHTHHHRDQCWGDSRLKKAGASIAVPEYERHLFEQAEVFWQSRRIYDNYNDRNTFFTIGSDIPVDATLNDYEYFQWRNYRFYILPAKGHTLGSSALLAEIDGEPVAFTGDLMAAGGKLYQLHAMEYSYAAMEGILFTLQSLQALRKLAPLRCLPSHGSLIRDVNGDITRLERRLMDAVRLGRGLRVAGRESFPETAYLPSPKLIPLSTHLLWTGSWSCASSYVILSASGKALFLDYGHSFMAHMHIFADHEGLDTMRFIEHHLDELREDYGVTSFDLVIPTHIHDDHTCGIPHLQRHFGTRCWALRQVAELLANPAAWASTPCLFPKPIRIDRTFEDGDRFHWEEYEFEIYHAPGQTEFHSMIVGHIDGRKVAFTGDNVFMHEVMTHGNQVWNEPYQTTVLRNSFQLAMHRRCAELMRRLSPEVICPGHRDILYFSKREIDTYCDFVERKERIFRELVDQPADHYIDLFWARLLPYVSVVKPQTTLEYQLLLRNNLDKRTRYEARLLPPPGWECQTGLNAIELEAHASGTLGFSVRSPAAADGVRRLLTAEVFIDGISQGPLVEALVTVQESAKSTS